MADAYGSGPYGETRGGSTPLVSRRISLTTKDPAKATACVGLLRRLRRPAFHNLEREKAEESESGKLDVETQVLRDLGDGAAAVELRSELCFGHRQAQLLHPLVTVAGVGRNGRGVRPRLLAQLGILSEAQGIERPLIDILRGGRQLIGPTGQLLLLEGESDPIRPEL